MGSRQLILIKRWQKLAKKYPDITFTIEAHDDGGWGPRWFGDDYAWDGYATSFEDAIIWLETEMKQRDSELARRKGGA